MKGAAAEFVFDQLPDVTLTDYKAVTTELKNRFAQIEDPDAYAVLFANRDQQSCESLQEYAAELTHLYEKAHPNRSTRVKHEDVKRRWLDGVQDQKSAKHMEFVKNPQTIQEAIKELVKLQRLDSHDDHKPKTSKDAVNKNLRSEKELWPGESSNQLFSNKVQPESYKQQHRQVVQRCQRISRCHKKQNPLTRSTNHQLHQSREQVVRGNEPSDYPSHVQNNRHESPQNDQNTKRFQCFRCCGYNHIARNCPSRQVSSYRGDSQPWLRSVQSMPSNLHLHKRTSNQSDRCGSGNKCPPFQLSKSDPVLHSSMKGPSNMVHNTGKSCSSYSVQSPFPPNTQYATSVKNQQTTSAPKFASYT